MKDAQEAIDYALGRALPAVSRYSTQAVNIMKGMGWVPGEGLGKRSDGRPSPIPPPPPASGKGGATRGLGGGPRTRGRGGDRGGGEGNTCPSFLALSHMSPPQVR